MLRLISESGTGLRALKKCYVIKKKKKKTFQGALEQMRAWLTARCMSVSLTQGRCDELRRQPCLGLHDTTKPNMPALLGSSTGRHWFLTLNQNTANAIVAKQIIWCLWRSWVLYPGPGSFCVYRSTSFLKVLQLFLTLGKLDSLNQPCDGGKMLLSVLVLVTHPELSARLHLDLRTVE